MENFEQKEGLSLQAILKQFADSVTPKTTKQSSFDPLNYLNDRLNPKESKKTLCIRLLPFEPGEETPFHQVWMHSVRVNKQASSSGWKRFVCPTRNHMGDKCPYCEIASQAYSEANSATSEVAKKHSQTIGKENVAKPFWIVRCIERGHEDEGVKFWLFPASKDKKGIGDMILGLASQRAEAAAKKGQEYNLFSLENGKDLFITITRNDKGNRVYTIADDDEKTPLSTDPEQASKWINDPKKWHQVYTVKPYEFMHIYAMGGVPIRQKDGSYINSEDLEQQKEEARTEQQAEAQANEKAVEQQMQRYTVPEPSSLDNIVINEVEEDLPF